MFQFAYREGGSGVPVIKLFPITASEVLSKGEPVNLESGLLDAGAAADTEFVGICNHANAEAAAGDLMEVILCDNNTVFKVDYITGNKTSLADSDIGTAFDLDSTDNTSIDLDDTTGGAWVIVDYDNDLGVAFVKCLSSKRADVVI